MIRKLLLSTALVAAAAGTAFAADLPARVAAPAPYIAAPIFTWTGFYVGLNAGASFNGNGGGSYAPFGFPAGATFTGVGVLNNGDDTGFTGGAQAGYNMQFGSFVAGVEADINYIDRSNGGSVLVTTGGTAGVTPGIGDTYRLTRGDGNNYYGTVRGRLGFAFDRALVYATGGWAWGGKQGGVSGTFTGANNAPLSTGVVGPMIGSGNGSSSGWALGGGVEYAFSNSMSVKLEYLHVDLGSNTRTVLVNGANPTRGFTFDGDNKFDVVRAGVNFRF